MAARHQVADDAALAAADLERRRARLGHEGEERVAVTPVGVVIERTRPGEPPLRALLEAHGS
jgi:hypothetical protein